ncbi:MAG: transposase family protein [Hyphomicrobiales bacterium]|nr:transposase family protein [Hyphomicrobiales bacterium]
MKKRVRAGIGRVLYSVPLDERMIRSPPTILRDVPDPRTGNATRQADLDALVIVLTASISGCETCVEMAALVEDRDEFFREFLSLPNGLPSHDSFSRLFRLIDPAVLSDGL